MRSDPDVKIIANDATFAVTRCTELFIGEHYAEELHAVVNQPHTHTHTHAHPHTHAHAYGHRAYPGLMVSCARTHARHILYNLLVEPLQIS